MELIAFRTLVRKMSEVAKTTQPNPLFNMVILTRHNVVSNFFILKQSNDKVVASTTNLLFLTGVKYEGEFDDGVFHGNGELKYGNGVIVKGKWKKGQLTDRRIIFADGLEYCERNWSYCKVPDRR